jgi:hypothetical protein
MRLKGERAKIRSKEKEVNLAPIEKIVCLSIPEPEG